MNKVGVIGAGAWGTALAETVCRANSNVILWAREEEVVSSINKQRENKVFLPDTRLNTRILATNDINDLATVDLILLVTPAQHLRSICAKLSFFLSKSVPLVVCSKGIEVGSNKLMPEVVKQELLDFQLLILSGPTFAREVASGLPTAVTLACEDQILGKRVAEMIGTPQFRPYLSNDLIGSAIGGAVKNVLAIACGLVEGMGLGDNARASILTRGLAEVVRLAVCLGGQPQTLMGLSGLGECWWTESGGENRARTCTRYVHNAAGLLGRVRRCEGRESACLEAGGHCTHPPRARRAFEHSVVDVRVEFLSKGLHPRHPWARARWAVWSDDEQLQPLRRERELAHARDGVRAGAGVSQL